MNPLSEESKKRLTRFLVEDWHEKEGNNCFCGYEPFPPCSFSETDGELQHHISLAKRNDRSFSPDDWQSLGDLKNKLVEKGMWDKFSFRCEGIWERDNHYVDFDDIAFTLWLINPAIFIPLVDEFLKEKEGT